MKDSERVDSSGERLVPGPAHKHRSLYFICLRSCECTFQLKRIDVAPIYGEKEFAENRCLCRRAFDALFISFGAESKNRDRRFEVRTKNRGWRSEITPSLTPTRYICFWFLYLFLDNQCFSLGKRPFEFLRNYIYRCEDVSLSANKRIKRLLTTNILHAFSARAQILVLPI